MRDEMKVGIFSLLIFGALLFASRYVDLSLYLLIALTLFFAAFSFLFNFRLKKALNDENKNKFVHVFLGMTGIKMLGCLVFLVVVLALTKHDKFNIGVCVMTYYLLYTIFEVALWRRKLKP